MFLDNFIKVVRCEFHALIDITLNEACHERCARRRGPLNVSQDQTQQSEQDREHAD